MPKKYSKKSPKKLSEKIRDRKDYANEAIGMSKRKSSSRKKRSY